MLNNIDDAPEGFDDRPHCADCARVVVEGEVPVTTDGRWSYYSCCVTAEQVAAHAGEVA